MKEPRSPHVLNASSNLIGFCFLVVTSLRFLSKAATTVVDELATVSMVFFMAASILSFLSLKKVSRRAAILEGVASGLFLLGLLLLFISTVLFSLRLIN